MLQGVEKKTEELNRSILPRDVKVRPYYDRSDLVRVTTDTVEDNLLRGMVLVLIVLIFFLRNVRAALITALTIPLALLFAFVFLHATRRCRQSALHRSHRFRHHHRRHHRHGGEHLPRTGRCGTASTFDVKEVILAAARDVDRPIFYSVAVIIAGYLPIYALTGPAGRLFRPMANTMAFALVGALILTLTMVPVLASYWFKKGIKDKRNPRFRRGAQLLRQAARLVPQSPEAYALRGAGSSSARRCCWSRTSAASSCRTWMKARLWVRATMPYTISFEEAGKFAPKIRDILKTYPQVTVVGSELGTAGRRHRSHRLLQLRVLRRTAALHRQDLAAEFHPQQGRISSRTSGRSSQPFPA